MQKLNEAARDRIKESRLIQRLDWAYNEVRYVAPSRNASTNPRAPDVSAHAATSNIRISLASIPDDRKEIAQRIINAFTAAGYGTIQQIAALANAIAESN